MQEVCARHTDKEWIAALCAAANPSAHPFKSVLATNGGTKGDTTGTVPEDSGPRYTMYHALNHSTHGQRHFGVAMFVCEPSVVAHTREVGWDAEGHVLVLEMLGGWALLNIYGLNGSEFMWRDLLGQAAPKTRNEHKREFNQLLMQECIGLQRQGLRVVLAGDFNVSLGEQDCHLRLRTEYPHGLTRSEFTEGFMPEVGVADVFREKYPDKQAYSWFAKGKPPGVDCARVDYALVERRDLVDNKNMNALDATSRSVQALEPRINRTHPGKPQPLHIGWEWAADNATTT